MIRAENLTKTYSGDVVALNSVDLHVDAGDIVYLTGHSGAGKTTLLKLIMGAERTRDGELTVLNCDLITATDNEIRSLRRNLGVVFQDFRLLPGQSAFSNVELGLRIAGVNYRDCRERADYYLTQVGLGDKQSVNVEQMSWGEQQRVAIARAIARMPGLILADEPTGNLDPDASHRIMDLLCSAASYGAAVIIATHDVELVDAKLGRIIHLADGMVAAGGGPDAA